MNTAERNTLRLAVDQAQRGRIEENGGIVYPLEQDLLRENRSLYRRLKKTQQRVRELENDLAAAQRAYRYESIRAGNYKALAEKRKAGAAR